jgi:metal-responsive CopG/Arc/MetJ family transcriptional regulator
MKHKLSISIEEDIVLKLFDRMKSREFRNKSHFFEVAAAKMLEEVRG